MTLDMTLTAIRAGTVVDARHGISDHITLVADGLIGRLQDGDIDIEFPLENERPIGTRYLLSLTEIVDA